MNSAQSKTPAPPPTARLLFPLGPGTDWRGALQGVPLRSEPVREERELRLDSFDRRLARKGIVLGASGAAPNFACRESRPDARSEPHAFSLAALPRFAWDFPPPRDAALAEVLEARALEVRGEHIVRTMPCSVLDGEEKRVAWLEEEEHLFTPAKGGPAAPQRRLVLRGVRGYDREFEGLAARLGAAGLVARPLEPFDPDPPAAPRVRKAFPTVGARGFSALGLIVRAQLDVLAECEEGVLAARDEEYLHDYRVALRRLRSLLGQLDGILPEEERATLVAELRALATATGPARDLDVFLFDLRLTDPALRADLAPVVQAVETERARLQPDLAAGLSAARESGLLARVAAAFAPRRPLRELGKRAGRPFRSVLARRLARRLDQATARTAALAPATSAPTLHELRITFKKLRYLLECARGLAPRADLEACFALLKGLQAALGALQDASVQEELVTTAATGCAASAGVRAHLALGRFLGLSARRAELARARLDGLAREFLAPAGQAAFERLLADLRGAAA